MHRALKIIITEVSSAGEIHLILYQDQDALTSVTWENVVHALLQEQEKFRPELMRQRYSKLRTDN